MLPSDPRSSAPIRSSLADDPDYNDLLEMFDLSLKEAAVGLRESHSAGDAQSIQREAHRIKGAGGAYGFEGLTTVAHQVEDACKARDAAAIEQTLNDLLDYISRIEV